MHRAAQEPRGLGFTLMELLAVLAIIGVLAVLVVPRVGTNVDQGEAAACHSHKGVIEIQAQLWRRINGSWPNASLSDIGANAEFFPEGVPTCPVDGSAYTIDTSTGRVVGHDH